MLPLDSGRRRRLTDRARCKASLRGFEALETREVLSYSPLGYSLPDLAVIPSAGANATYGGTIGVTAQVTNLGASSIIEPLNQAPGSASSADAPISTTNVFFSNSPRLNASSILIGQLTTPAISQNNTITVSATLTLPQRPAGYPAFGKNAYIIMVADAGNSVQEIDEGNNVSRAIPVKMTPALPDLKTYALDVPPTIQPGDTIQPNIEIANVGSADTQAQGPVTVLLVASLNKNFGPGSSIIGSYTIDNIPAASNTATTNFVLGDANVTPPPYVRTIFGANATVPNKPGKYYIGVIVDPSNTIRELSEYGKPGSAHTRLDFAHLVKTIPGLPPAGVISAPVTTTFPYPVAATTQGTIVGVPASATANSIILGAGTPTTNGSTSPTIGNRQYLANLNAKRLAANPGKTNTNTSLVTIPTYLAAGSTLNPSDLLATGSKTQLVGQRAITNLATGLTFSTTTSKS